MLKANTPYREPDPKQMHEKEKAKLIRHHTKRLRELGADEKLISAILEQAPQQPLGSFRAEEPTEATTGQRFRRYYAAKDCRGALGFRARSTRKQEYSVEKDPSTGAPPRGRPKTKNKQKPE